jgi:uncharacterized coiled-coil protein SlyX
MEPLDSRVANLEIKLNAAEHHIETLNKDIYKQRAMIDQLILEIRGLKERSSSGANAQLSDELPPHY